MSSCLLVRLCQDTAGIQVVSCVMTGIEQKSKKKKGRETGSPRQRKQDRNTDGKLWRPSEGWLCLLHIHGKSLGKNDMLVAMRVIQCVQIQISKTQTP